jgi:hypothetical protein
MPEKESQNPVATGRILDLWAAGCDTARALVEDSPHAAGNQLGDLGDQAIDAANRLLALAYHLKGVACPTCDGYRERAYGSTATWRGGGLAGQAVTSDVCDSCWGTGRTDIKGADLRAIWASLAAQPKLK